MRGPSSARLHWWGTVLYPAALVAVFLGCQLLLKLAAVPRGTEASLAALPAVAALVLSLPLRLRRCWEERQPWQRLGVAGPTPAVFKALLRGIVKAALLLALVIGLATLQLMLESGIKVVTLQANWFDGSLIKMLDRLLLIFIALEVLQNVTAYLRDQVVQIELVLLTALTAVARKVIVLPPGTENKPLYMAGFGLIVAGIASAYWLVLRARGRQEPIDHAQS